MFITALFIVASIWKQSRYLSTSHSLDNQNVVSSSSGRLFTNKMVMLWREWMSKTLYQVKESRHRRLYSVDLIFMNLPEEIREYRESTSVVAWDWGGGSGDYKWEGGKFLVQQKCSKIGLWWQLHSSSYLLKIIELYT